jgi:hypothetical protein
MSDIPFVAIANEELDRSPSLTDRELPCKKCGTICKVEDSKPPMLQFTHCTNCGSDYLVGFKGRDIRGTFKP